MGIYKAFTSSVIRSIEDFRKSSFPTATYFDWDSHDDISTLPPGDLCGPAGLGFTREDAQVTVAFSFGLCTVDDTNLFRLRSVMDALEDAYLPQTTIPLYDPSGNVTDQWIIIKTPTVVAPISKAQVRTLQFLTLTGLVSTTSS